MTVRIHRDHARTALTQPPVVRAVSMWAWLDGQATSLTAIAAATGYHPRTISRHWGEICSWWGPSGGRLEPTDRWGQPGAAYDKLGNPLRHRLLQLLAMGERAAVRVALWCLPVLRGAAAYGKDAAIATTDRVCVALRIGHDQVVGAFQSLRRHGVLSILSRVVNLLQADGSWRREPRKLACSGAILCQGDRAGIGYRTEREWAPSGPETREDESKRAREPAAREHPEQCDPDGLRRNTSGPDGMWHDWVIRTPVCYAPGAEQGDSKDPANLLSWHGGAWSPAGEVLSEQRRAEDSVRLAQSQRRSRNSGDRVPDASERTSRRRQTFRERWDSMRAQVGVSMRLRRRDRVDSPGQEG